MFPIISFNTVPTTWLYEKIFRFSKIQTDYPLTNQFNDIGYGSIFIVTNLGSLYLMITLWVILLTLTVLLRKFQVFDRFEYLKKKINNYYEENFWNGIMDVFFQSYLVLAVSSFIGSNDLRLDSSYSTTEIYNSVLAIVVMTLTVAFPFILFIVLNFKLRIFDKNSKVC